MQAQTHQSAKRRESASDPAAIAPAGKGSRVARTYGGQASRAAGPAESAPSGPAVQMRVDPAATEAAMGLGSLDGGALANPSPAPSGRVVQLKSSDAPSVPAPPEEDKPGFFGRIGNGLKKAGAGLWSGVTGAYKVGLGAVHAVAEGGTRVGSAIGRGSEWLGDKLGADREGPTGWFGKGLRGLGQGLQSGSDKVRDVLGLDQDGNEFTDHVDIPEDRPAEGDDPGHVQQYSELGLPMTADAWEMQDAIDGGKLRDTYDRTLLSSLQEGGVLDRLVADGVIGADRIPASFAELEPEEFAQLVATVKSEVGTGRGFLDSLEPEEREAFQEQVIHGYMQRAQNDEDAAFMLELMPTDTTHMPDQMLESAGDALIRGQGPNDFKVGETVGKIRQGAVTMADRLRAGGDNVYALPVPYANTVPNIIGRTGTPSDGADHLHNYLEHLGPEMKTVTTGYSQGGAAVLDYVSRYGDQDGLDYALALAPMGGADQHGEHGVYSGERNGVETLSVMHQGDPAQGIHGDHLVDLISPMLTFVSEDRQKARGMDGDLHSGFYGDPKHPLNGADPLEAMGAGTMGYPTGYVTPMLDDLFAGRMSDTPYKRRGDWNFDLRDELVQNGENGQLDPSRLRQDGRDVADRYLPQ